MKELLIKSLELHDFRFLQETLESQTFVESINHVNWENFTYCPKVTFRIGHTSTEIALKFSVSEKHIKAIETRLNGDVYKDSCVEFFISFDNKNYYNFEFNSIGTVHLAYGPQRERRKYIPPDIIRQIKVESSLGNQPFEEKSGDFYWELFALIPKSCFTFNNMNSLNNTFATANFYKCGDETTTPHYISWSPVKTRQPDFHRPEYFGNIRFE